MQYVMTTVGHRLFMSADQSTNSRNRGPQCHASNETVLNVQLDTVSLNLLRNLQDKEKYLCSQCSLFCKYSYLEVPVNKT